MATMQHDDLAGHSDTPPQGDGQPETSHTMLEALRLVARSHGLHLSREQLLRDHARGPEEVRSAVLIAAGERAGLKCRRVKATFAQLMRIGRAVPAILVMRDGSARVLDQALPTASPPVVVLRHPAWPHAPYPADNVGLAEQWDGDLILFKRQSVAEEEDNYFSAGWVVRQMMKEGRLFRDIGISALMLSVFALAPPLLYFLVLNRVLVHQRMSSLVVLAVGVLFLLIFDTAFGALRRYLLAQASARIDARLSDFIFGRVISLPMEVFERQPVGVITHRIGEANRIRAFLAGPVFTAGLDSITLLVLLPLMFYLNMPLTFFVLGVAVVMVLVVLAFVPQVGKAHARVVRADQRKGAMLVETVHGMRTVKSLALEGTKRHQWDEAAAESVRAHREMALVANRPQTIMQPLEKLIMAGSLLLGCYMVLSDPANGMVIGSLVAFTMLAGRATQPFVSIAGMLQQVQEVRGAVTQVANLVNSPPEETRAGHGLRPRFAGGVSFENVTFRYPGSQAAALDDVSFTITPGSVVGIMGRSGSGKTTITRLLQGLNQDFSGLLKIDGVDIRQMDLHHLRANLGVVLQENFLFSGTVRANIAAARSDASFDEVIEAARLAGAEEFIERLPRGYDTHISEGASNLSGGQRQRLAIARALLVDPPIMILDEATSALDPDSEAIVNNNLRHIADGRTMVVVSHRLASLVDCDQIIVMERGRVYDTGKHEELLTRCDIYRHLWFQQNRHQSTSSTNPEGAKGNERAIPGPSA